MEKEKRKIVIASGAKQSLAFCLLLLIAYCFFSSCEKVINIDLNSADPKIVIEAEISDQSFCNVKLSKTINFNESNTFPAVTGAIVKISDNLGNAETLAETSAGKYIGSVLTGTSGRIYTIEISAEGKIYTAVSTLPSPVNIDSLFLTTDGMPGPGSNKYISVKYNDPAGVNNYYRFIQIINGVLQDAFYITSDELQDGQAIITPLHSRDKLLPGDSVTVHLLSIDAGVYDYFRSFLQLSGGGGGPSALPANPTSNFNNGALGYFSAHAIKSKSIIIN